MIRSILALLLAGHAVLALAASQSSEPLVVTSGKTITPLVELYTSEGCSSCPPADKLLSRLGNAEIESFELVPLAFHVDYWNWLGWPDPYSQPKFTDRQRKIGAINRQRSIYTPEMVVAGREARGGDRIYSLIDRYNRTPSEVSVTLSLETRSPTWLQAELEIDNMSDVADAEVFLAVFENNITREIGAGENAGKTLVYDFVVRHWSMPFAVSDGQSSHSIALPVGADWDRANLGVAAIVMDRESSDTLQAVSTEVSRLFATNQ